MSLRSCSIVRAVALAAVAGSFTSMVSVAAAQNPVMVTNINTSLNPIGVSSQPRSFTSLGAISVFTASDPAHGAELWRTDGTTAGTFLIKDINAGPNASNPSEFCVVGSKAYFIADNGGGQDLWVTDGTSAGTIRLRGVAALSGAGAPPKWYLTNVNGTLFFAATTLDEGVELWKSDGTAAGTVLVKDILPGPVDANIRNLCAVGGTLYFSATDTGLGNELWKSDGTEAGTVQVKEIYPGDQGSEPDKLTAFGGQLYFVAENGVNGRELWKSNGTDAGTTMVSDVVAGAVSSNPNWLTIFNGQLHFVVDSPTATAQSIYRTNGVTTTPVAGYDFGQQITKFSELVTTPTKLYFRAYTIADGEELFRLKAVGTGAEITSNIVVGLAGSLPKVLTVVGENVYLQANSLVDGIELWKWDGSTATMVKNINNVGGASSYPTGITRFGSSVLFGAQDGIRGIELWISDGTAPGTVLVKDIAQNDGDSYPSNFTLFRNKLLFSADKGLGAVLPGREPWITDGTTAGTFMLKDINPNEVSSVTTADFFSAGPNKAYFNATNDLAGRELWVTDGTTAGTVLVKDINPLVPSAMTAAPNYAMIGDTLYFPALDNVSGTELWKSDGTGLGTVRVRDLAAGVTSGMGIAGNYSLAAIGSTIWFAGNTAGNGVELYKSDGTSAGTVRMTDIAAGIGSSQPGNITSFNGTTYFTASTGALGTEWYRLAPVTNAVQLLKDINPGNGSSTTVNAVPPLVLNGQMYFVADDSFTGAELWITDGNPANPNGTHAILDLNVFGSANPTNLTALQDGRVLFVADDGVHGRELWITDGTGIGTHMVIDLKPGAENGIVPGRFATLGARVYFAGDDSQHGIELWATNGDAGSTSLLTDIHPGLGSSNVSELRVMGNSLVFSATDGLHGQETYVVLLKCSIDDIADGAGNPGSDGTVNEGDYNAFFQGFFDALPYCDIADDLGNPLPSPGSNSGVNEGDYNAFFAAFFLGC